MSESEETAQNFTLNSIDEALEAIRTAGMVIVVDDADRENEGDLICSAEMISPETVSFMLRHGAGVLCVPVTGETADQLHLTPIVDSSANETPFRTNFLTPVDHVDAAIAGFIAISPGLCALRNQG